MQAFDLAARTAIQKRLKEAQRREALAIVAELCGDELIAPASPIAREVTVRFTVDGDMVRDALTGLVWTRETLTGGRRKWADAKQVATDCRIGGFTDWRLPTIRELLSIVDYQRSEPAIDPAFQCESAWYWSDTPLASSPSGCAWFVFFFNGYSDWYFHYYEGFVRAVRPGQLIGTLG